MQSAHEHDSQADDRSGVTRTHANRADGADGAREVAVPATVHASDPRLAHGQGASASLMALQRTAGNAAVAAMVGDRPPIQRAVEINELTTNTTVSDSAPTSPGAAGPDASAGPVTSDGGNTTITGGQITLAAPMTEAQGVIRADTIIAENVIGSNYTPGAGNVW